jgi:hypothetical protein
MVRKPIDLAAGAREHAPMSASPQSKHYRVIYADPPWTFATYSRKGKGRSPEAYYDCMSLADIKAKLRKPELFYNHRSFFTGLGFWTRANPEPCLLATRGKPHRRRADVPKLIVSPRREHSRKPDEAYDRIEALCEGPYLEMFARFPRPGWDRWGCEADASETGQRRWRADSYPDAPQAAE